MIASKQLDSYLRGTGTNQKAYTAAVINYKRTFSLPCEYFPSMNFFALSSTLFATLCLVAETSDPGDAPVSEVGGLRGIIMEKHPETFASYLVTTHRWKEEVARAFTIGQVLGSNCDVQNTSSNSSNSSNSPGMKKNCTMLKFRVHDSQEATLKVDMNSLQSAISADQLKNLFKEHFDMERIQNPVNYENESTLDDVRRLFANHAKTEDAMMAIDVAILRWLVQVIKAKPDNCTVVFVSKEVVLALCSLSMHSNIVGLCKDDILAVLTHLQNFTDSGKSPFDMEDYYRPSLVTLIKFLPISPVREKVMKILTKVCEKRRYDFVNTKMLLGAEHEFVKLLERNHTKDELDDFNKQLLEQEKTYERKIHSMVGYSGFKYSKNDFVNFPVAAQFTALIWNDNSKSLYSKETFIYEQQKLITFANMTIKTKPILIDNMQ